MQRSHRASELAQCDARYELDLARGASHLASTLSYATLESAIAETVGEFLNLHGGEHLPVFLELLARRLSERKKPEAASALRFHMNCGRPPTADELRTLWASVGAAMSA
ncbi:hypothetical protein [Trinickia terrae]|uniref:hypothetical protein n=1 Tax=Trinickia terrae TaxID=2571161 RepID=UPI001981F053|nr:hypothetical protein [Trinickia terrae]